MPNIRIAANQKADLEHLYQQWSGKLSKEKRPEELLKPEPMVWTIPSIQTKPGVVVPMEETRINDEFADFLTERRFPFEII